jgi:hypothetical protein
VDTRDGRGRRVVAPLAPLVFTIPYSGAEILLKHDCGLVGAVYHPTKMTSVIPWSAECSHCRGGRQVGVDLSTKRAIQTLCSRIMVDDVEVYSVLTNGEPCSVLCDRQGGKGILFRLLWPGRSMIDVPWSNGHVDAKRSDLSTRSKILERALKLIASAKPISKREAAACLKPLLDVQKRDGIPRNRRYPCLKIDWASLV